MVEQVGIRFPGLAGVVRSWLLGLPPDSRVRRAVMPTADRTNHEAFNRRDLDAHFMNFDPEIRIRVIPDRQGGVAPDIESEYRGREGMREVIERFDQAWEDWRLDTGEIIDLGDRHICLCRYVARGRGSGLSLDHPVAHVVTIRDRRIVELDFYWDQDQALKAVGLSQ